MRRCDSYYSIMPRGPFDALRLAAVTSSKRSSAVSGCVRRGTRSARRHGLIHRRFERFSEWGVDWANTLQARTSTARGWEKLSGTGPVTGCPSTTRSTSSILCASSSTAPNGVMRSTSCTSQT